MYLCRVCGDPYVHGSFFVCYICRYLFCISCSRLRPQEIAAMRRYMSVTFWCWVCRENAHDTLPDSSTHPVYPLSLEAIRLVEQGLLGEDRAQAPQRRANAQAPQGRVNAQAPQGRVNAQAPQGRANAQAPQGRVNAQENQAPRQQQARARAAPAAAAAREEAQPRFLERLLDADLRAIRNVAMMEYAEALELQERQRNAAAQLGAPAGIIGNILPPGMGPQLPPIRRDIIRGGRGDGAGRAANRNAEGGRAGQQVAPNANAFMDLPNRMAALNLAPFRPIDHQRRFEMNMYAPFPVGPGNPMAAAHAMGMPNLMGPPNPMHPMRPEPARYMDAYMAIFRPEVPQRGFRPEGYRYFMEHIEPGYPVRQLNLDQMIQQMQMDNAAAAQPRYGYIYDHDLMGEPDVALRYEEVRHFLRNRDFYLGDMVPQRDLGGGDRRMQAQGALRRQHGGGQGAAGRAAAAAGGDAQAVGADGAAADGQAAAAGGNAQAVGADRAAAGEQAAAAGGNAQAVGADGAAAGGQAAAVGGNVEPAHMNVAGAGGDAGEAGQDAVEAAQGVVEARQDVREIGGNVGAAIQVARHVRQDAGEAAQDVAEAGQDVRGIRGNVGAAIQVAGHVGQDAGHVGQDAGEAAQDAAEAGQDVKEIGGNLGEAAQGGGDAMEVAQGAGEDAGEAVAYPVGNEVAKIGVPEAPIQLVKKDSEAGDSQAKGMDVQMVVGNGRKEDVQSADEAIKVDADVESQDAETMEASGMNTGRDGKHQKAEGFENASARLAASFARPERESDCNTKAEDISQNTGKADEGMQEAELAMEIDMFNVNDPVDNARANNLVPKEDQ